MRIKDINPPPIEPVTLDAAKEFLRVTHAAEDGLIESLIVSARIRIEALINTSLITRATPSSLRLILRRSWASYAPQVWGVEIEFDAGFGPEIGDVPMPLRQAILLLIAEAYEHRDRRAEQNVPGVPFMVDALLMPYRMLKL